MVATKKIRVGDKSYDIGDSVDTSPISKHELKILIDNGTLTKAKKTKKGK